MPQKDIPLYVRTHSDSFCEPLTLSTTSLHRLSTGKQDPGPRAEKSCSLKKQLLRQKSNEAKICQSSHSSIGRVSAAICRDFSKDTCDRDAINQSDSHTNVKGQNWLKTWKSTLEPQSSWLLLFFAIIPMNIIISVELISFGVYYIEYVETFQTSRSAVGMVSAIKAGVISVFGIITGTFVMRYPAKYVALVGGTIIVVTKICCAFVPNVYVLYLTQGVTAGVGTSICTMTTAVLVQQHFSKNRVLGGGLNMLGYSLGQLIGPTLSELLIQHYGWRGATIITAALYGHIIPCSLVLFDPEELMPNKKSDVTEADDSDVDSDGDDDDDDSSIDGDDKCTKQKNNKSKSKMDTFRQILKETFNFSSFKNLDFTLICIAAMLGRYNIKTFLDHEPSKAVSLGISRSSAAFLISAFSLSAIAIRILTTFAANLKGVNRIIYYGCGFLIGALGSFLTLFHSLTLQTVSAVVHGIHTGFTNTIQTVIVVDVMGIDGLARSLALFNLLVGLMSMFAAPFGGYLYDITESYDPPFIVAGSFGFASGLLCLFVGIKQQANIGQSTGMAVDVEKHTPTNTDDEKQVHVLQNKTTSDNGIVDVKSEGCADAQVDLNSGADAPLVEEHKEVHTDTESGISIDVDDDSGDEHMRSQNVGHFPESKITYA